ncbi:MAG: putative tellurium resistance membrane protein TerC [Crocinitomicaceae bacterium]|jgi:predicted tellurium resistance membrane protein TerC
MDFSILLTWEGITYVGLLCLLEIVLGIDNIIFISIISDRLPLEKQRSARNTGLLLALFARLGLLWAVAWVMTLTDPLFTVFGKEISGQSLVLLGGGLFLIYKSTTEMHNSVAGEEEEVKKGKVSLSSVIMQIVLIDIVFSFDSIISAIGMTNDLAVETGKDPMIIIYIAVVVSMIVMMLFAKQISTFISNNPTIKMLALSFLVAIGVILVAEAFGEHVPKGYIYFALVYALLVEVLNIRMRKNKSKKAK